MTIDDPEISAITVCVQSLTPLEAEAQDRVIEYVQSFLHSRRDRDRQGVPGWGQMILAILEASPDRDFDADTISQLIRWEKNRCATQLATMTRKGEVVRTGTGLYRANPPMEPSA